MAMTLEEKDRLIDAALEAELAGDEDKASEILKYVPISAELAMGLKNAVGSDVMRAVGYNYAEAEAKYGSDWLK
jgi:hypothetical protein